MLNCERFQIKLLHDLKMALPNLQKKTVRNSFSSNNLSNIFLFTSSISFLISKTSCEVNQLRTFSYWCRSPSYSNGTCLLKMLKNVKKNLKKCLKTKRFLPKIYKTGNISDFVFMSSFNACNFNEIYSKHISLPIDVL